MKIILVSDLHLTLKESLGVTTSDGLNSRVHDKLKALSTAVNYAIENKANRFISLGDDFDALNPPEILRLKFIEALSPLFEANIPITIVMGNHVYNANYFNLQSEATILKLLRSNMMEIISEIKVEDKELPIAFIPWVRIEEAKAFLKANPNRIIFHHLPIRGAILNNYEYLSKEGLSQDSFENQIALFGGHYHKHQIDNNSCYVGSLVKQDFGERGEKKGFCVLNSIDSSLDLEFIEIKDREFIQFDFSEPNDPIGYIEQLSNLNEAVVKTTFTGSNTWLYKINKSQYLYVLESKNALRVLQPEYSTIEEGSQKANAENSRKPFEDSINKYCQQKNKKVYEPLMLSILNEVTTAEAPK